MKKLIFLSTAILIATNLAFSQGTAINKTGATAHNSALLDLSDTTKGILIPRMKKANKLAISNPATGLMVYQTNDTTGFWYYNGAKWMQVAGQTSGGGNSCAPAGSGETLINFNGCLYVKNVNENGTYTWADAKTACTSLGAGWYLPGKLELDVLHQNWDAQGTECQGGTCPLSGFSGIPFWTSTAADGNVAIILDFNNGTITTFSKTNTAYVRCVRR